MNSNACTIIYVILSKQDARKSHLIAWVLLSHFNLFDSLQLHIINPIKDTIFTFVYIFTIISSLSLLYKDLKFKLKL